MGRVHPRSPLHSVSSSRPPKPASGSLVSRLVSKVKSALGLKTKGAAPSQPAHAPSEAARSLRAEGGSGPARREARPDRRVQGAGDSPGRPPREPRGDRVEGARGNSSDRGAERDRGGRSGGRGRERSERSSSIQNWQSLPPPAAPEVPAGPYPEAFEILGLSPAVLAAVKESGYETPTEIQRRAIPVVLEGRDVIGASQTGTGKTAAFALPSISRLGAPGNFRVLVLEPTRELALQVVEQFEKYGKHSGLRVIAVYGGVGYEKQRKALQEGVDVVVATPGRLLDFMGDGTAKVAGVEVLVLDEVDRMLDMGFLPDVRRIVEATPKTRQTLFFSATMPPQIKNLADFALRDPISVEVGIAFSPADTVSHFMYPVASDQREELLLAILKQTHFSSLMVFTRTKAQADQLYSSLKQGGEYKVAVMHSDISQKDRERALKGFRDGEFEMIVATDLAARGLDISGVTHVINYMVPENPEDYVHRIGRTGRAKKEGDAYTLFSAEELPFVESIERLIDQKIERRKLEGFSYKYTTVLDEEHKALAILRGRKKKRR